MSHKACSDVLIKYMVLGRVPSNIPQKAAKPDYPGRVPGIGKRKRSQKGNFL